MLLRWYEVVGCYGQVRLKTLALVITYINMVVCIAYLVLALVLCILLYMGNTAVASLGSVAADSAASFVVDLTNSIKKGILGFELPSDFVGDMNNILDGITSEKGTGRSEWKSPDKKIICRSGQGCHIGSSGSIRHRWEMGVVGIKNLLTFKLTLGNVIKLGFLVKHMLLVAAVWSVLLGVHLAFIVVLIIGINQEYPGMVIAYCIFGGVLLSLLLIMFTSHATICSVFPFIYFVHICLYIYTLLVIIAYLAEVKANEVECIDE